MDFKNLNHLLGNADLLLIDQILRGKFLPGMRMLDAGCGEGRNMVYFIRQGYAIYGIDRNADAVSMARLMASSINRSFTIENILQSTIEENPFPDEFFDVVICLHVLHHARSREHFFDMLGALVRVLRKNALLYLVMECKPEQRSRLGKSGGDEHDPSDADEKIYFTLELLDRICAEYRMVKADNIRTHQIEDQAKHIGIWLRKKKG